MSQDSSFLTAAVLAQGVVLGHELGAEPLAVAQGLQEVTRAAAGAVALR